MTTTQSAFWCLLTKSLLEHLNNLHGKDNWDAERFGKRQGRQVFAESIFIRLNSILKRFGYCLTTANNFSASFDRVLGGYREGLLNTFSLLADEYSRRAFIEILAYRVLGRQHVKLWTNTPAFWNARSAAESLPTGDRRIDTGIDVLRLAKTDIHPIGYPITIFTHPLVVTHQFLFAHYAYKKTDPPIQVSEGDYVIDAGAAWGDTALRFAHEVGEQGRIYSFEFEPKSLEILNENLQLNPELASRISIVKKALWRDSSTTLSFVPMGPGTHVSKSVSGQSENRVSSVSIDDFAESLDRVDFIKMDIEGAELPALQGAERTIRKHMPKLAVSLYHNLSDFVDIPSYLDSLGLEYNYYLDHSSIYEEETVLFAAPKAQIN
jgi:FkbM family methyltransferase